MVRTIDHVAARFFVKFVLHDFLQISLLCEPGSNALKFLDNDALTDDGT